MEITIDLEEDVYFLARELAEARQISLGQALSYLVRRGATALAPVVVKDGFPIFFVAPDTPCFGPQEVEAALQGDSRAGAP